MSFLKTENYQKFYAPKFHPNKEGHILIANKIKKIIESEIR